MKHPQIVKYFGLIICLSFVDAVFTIIWIQTGIAKEANPLMDILLALHLDLHTCFQNLMFLLFHLEYHTYTL